MTAFVKARVDAPPGFFAAEAAGLRWLAAAPGGPPLPAIRSVARDQLVLDRIPVGAPSAGAAEELGRALAAMHLAGADSYGASWPGFIGPLPMPNELHPGPWAAWFAERRLRPFLDSAELDPVARAAVGRVLDRISELAGPAEAPARVHGDLWSGNVVWAADGRAWLVDPAAHGGHRESDLAMLALFGLPHLDTVLAAYQEVHPLASGWRDRVALHQLWPLLVHATLFGGQYRLQVGSAARRAVAGG